jgi:predicted nucleic acid-binding protein
MIVADTNLILALLLETPERAVADAVLARNGQWVAPFLWRSELRNALALLVRRGRLDSAAATEVCGRARTVLAAEHAVTDGHVLRLAARSGCTAYDCEFVALAEWLAVPLVTFDREVLAAFPSIAIHPQEFAAGGFWGDRISEALVGYGLRSGEPLDGAGAVRSQRHGRRSASPRKRRAA